MDTQKLLAAAALAALVGGGAYLKYNAQTDPPPAPLPVAAPAEPVDPDSVPFPGVSYPNGNPVYVYTARDGGTDAG